MNQRTKLLHALQNQSSKNPLARSCLRVRSEVGRVDFSSCSSNGASDIFSLNWY